jgi:predicted dinucleotide-binding enzyme
MPGVHHRETVMQVAVVGSGDLARTLAHRLAIAGHEVFIAGVNSRDEIAGIAAGTAATPAPIEDAAAQAEVVFLAIPFGRHRELAADAFEAKIVVDATDYFPARDGRITELDEGRTTSSELVACHLRGARLVKAFNTINLLALGALGRVSADVTPIAVPMAGDDQAAKIVVGQLVVDLGFVPVDVGRLADSWRMQPGTPVHGLVSDERKIRIALDAA